jgi:cob(I)alamin adenosyltransferase
VIFVAGRLYTRRGDHGETDLMGGRVLKRKYGKDD